jgi:hypothetical protein
MNLPLWPVCLLGAGMLLISSCRPESLPLIWEDLSPSGDETLFRMAAAPDGTLWIAGGQTWLSGVVYRLDPGAFALQIELETGKAFLGLDRAADGTLAVTGVDGQIFLRAPQGLWQDRHPNRWDLSRAIRLLPGGRMVVAGGNAFEAGYMFTMDPGQGPMQSFEHLNRINELVSPDERTLLAAGYGVIYLSIDQGAHWEILDVSGDHFMQLAFPDSLTGYAVGYGGSILKTTNGGQAWKSLRNGRRLDTRGRPFRGVHFRDADTGVAVGDQGLAWLTRDGGRSWLQLEGLPARADLHCALLRGDTLLVAGDRGRLYRASLP